MGERGYVDVVLLAVVGQDEVLELDFDFDPLLVGQRGPNVVSLGDCRLVRFQYHLGSIVVDVKGAQDQDETREGCVARNGFKPIAAMINNDIIGT